MSKITGFIPKDERVGSVDSEIRILRKVFYVSEKLLANGKENASNELSLKFMFHPREGRDALFLTRGKHIMGVLEFVEPHRNWLINSNINSGQIYISTPIDGTFLMLRYLIKYCTEKAQALDSINGEASILSALGCEQNLRCVADVKIVYGTAYYKYNAEKTMAWLVVKTRRLAETLKDAGMHCGLTASSRNYMYSELAEEKAQDYLRLACELVGCYIDIELYKELALILDIPLENTSNVKRKSQNSVNSYEIKKIKLDHVLDSLDNVEEPTKSLPPNERILSTKQKALAKSAKGTKSIASFFKK